MNSEWEFQNPFNIVQFLFHYRNTPCAATGKTPAKLFLSWTPRTRLTLLHPELHNHLENHERRPAQLPAARSREFREGDTVRVKGTRACDPAWMVRVIIRRISAVTYVVNVENQERFVHGDHLVEATIPVAAEPNQRVCEFNKPIAFTVLRLLKRSSGGAL
ncbi:hypothetical protein MTO96_012494 [Rhipicephalus appendiculatus]